MSSTALKVDWCSYQAAKYAVMNWHYSKVMPSGRLAKFGVWEGGRFVGSVLFGRGAIPAIALPFGMTQKEVVELVRVALRDHKTPVTRIIRMALKRLKAHSPGLRIVVSYADMEQDHLGIIYQAGNWTYLGRTEAVATHMVVLGKIAHARSVYSRYGTHSVQWLRKHIDPEAKYATLKCKHKYATSLDKEARKILDAMSKPYPKRDKQAMAGFPTGTAAGQRRPSRSRLSEGGAV